jgi:hypothetical protein
MPAVLISLLGWWVVHHFNSKRDQSIKRRDIRLERLLDAYDAIAKEVANRKMTDDRRYALESALVELQVTGTPELVKLASDFGSSGKPYDLVPLVVKLRSEIRSELGLEETSSDFKWFRLYPNDRWNP